MKNVILVLLIAVMSACEQTHYDTEISKIDSMMVKVDSAQERLTKIDTSSFDKKATGYTKKTGFIQSYFKEKQDTIDRDLAMLMSDYRGLKKPYQSFKSRYKRNTTQLKFSKKQLSTLRHDLEHNLYDSTLVNKFMKEEMAAIEDAIAQSKQLESGKRKTAMKSARLEPKIDSVITELKSRR